MMERTVKLFRDGQDKTLRIPSEFDFPGDDAVIRKEGDRLIIEPVKRTSLLEYLKTLEPLDEEWPEIEDPPPDPVDL